MNFNCRLKELRKAKKLTQVQLAEQLGLTERQYQRLEANTSKPMYDNLLALAEYFNVSLDYLTGRSDYPDIIVMGKDGKPVIIEAMSPPKD